MSMSCLPIPKKLKQLPSSTKKAWKSLTSSLHPKLRHLNIPASVSATARRLLHLRPPNRHRHMGGARGGSLSYYSNKKQHYRHLQQQCSSGPTSPACTVYVDRLYGESSSRTRTAGPVEGQDHVPEQRRRRRRRREKVGNSMMERKSVGWKEYISSLPTIRGVDERAEEFISKFRQEIQLQREQSLLDFQQMLARSA